MRNSPHTDSARFKDRIFGALDEMRSILSLALSENAATAQAAKAAKPA